MVGNSGSGKTNMIHTFDKGVALNHSAPTVGVDYYSKNMDVDSNHKIKLQIWDTAGQEQFRSIIMGFFTTHSDTIRTRQEPLSSSTSPTSLRSRMCADGSLKSARELTNMLSSVLLETRPIFQIE